MERLTEWYDNGLREGVLVKEKRGEKEIKVLFEEVDDGYHAMCALKAYEDTGLTPEQIREIDRLYTEKCQEVAELRQKSEQIEYDYDAAKERCLKRQQKKENAGDIGEDAMTLAVKYGKGKKKKEKESGDEK